MHIHFGIGELYVLGFFVCMFGFMINETSKGITINLKRVNIDDYYHLKIIEGAMYGAWIGCMYGLWWPIFGLALLHNAFAI